MFVNRGSDVRSSSPTLSPRFRANTLKAPPAHTPDPTVASEKLTRVFHPLYRSLDPRSSTCYQIRSPTRDNPSLTSGSEIFHLSSLSRRPFWPHRWVWIETLRAIIPGLRRGWGERGSVLHPPAPPAGMYHAFFCSQTYGRSIFKVCFPPALHDPTFLPQKF